MIQLTRLNGESFTLNALFIEQIQSFPDTTITLTSNKKIIVRESEIEVARKIREFYQSIGLISVKEKQEKHER
ncbi:flagellar protein FlbD [Terribacillus saccharophilus]|uniref:Flagellar protein FlbD n=1 Tax=Terribacillus saccharophilus TaxID=361277 RepID=A0AAX2ECL4_9BACI|nr:flagellar FlbD family protein [Terribacillus saccharophilus]MCM3224919.1 flagellar FlbD family protein [Terribacillus saccharophilus]SEM73029.1 flagellar protein FlbD [Terribacillus saccharophilus]